MLSSDPYSHCLTADGELSMFVDLDRDESLMPPGWKSHTTPPLPGASLCVSAPGSQINPCDDNFSFIVVYCFVLSMFSVDVG